MTGRTGVTGSALLRLLHRLAGSGAGPDATNPNDTQQDFAEQLSQWLRWTDAVRFSAALDARPEVPAPVAAEPGGLDAAEARQVRDTLAAAIAEDARAVAAMTLIGVAPQDPKAAAADAAICRQRYASRQYAMGQSIGRLRERLRARMAQRSPELARLAAVDAVLEDVLGTQEQRLLGPLPGLLGRRFERLQRADDAEARAAAAAAAEAPAEENTAAATPAVAPEGRRWLPAFSQDMHTLLLAELEIRFHPVQGLVEALRQGRADGVAPQETTTT